MQSIMTIPKSAGKQRPAAAAKDTSYPTGFCRIPNEIIDAHARAIGPYGVAVYCVLVSFFNRAEAEAWPSLTTIATKLGISRRKALQTIQELEKHGLIEVRRQWKSNNHYAFPPRADGARQGGAPGAPGGACGAPDDALGGAPDAPGWCTTCTPSGAPHAPKPDLTNQNKEPDNTPPTPQGGDAAREMNGAPKPPPHIPEAFVRFWKCYPRRVGKRAALRAWRRIRPDAATVEAILAAVARQKSWPKWHEENGRFIPNPATWLNQGRWEDEEPAGCNGFHAPHHESDAERQARRRREREQAEREEEEARRQSGLNEIRTLRRGGKHEGQ
jgi:hypothetical protein